jgi:hypothetical protein
MKKTSGLEMNMAQFTDVELPKYDPYIVDLNRKKQS